MSSGGGLVAPGGGIAPAAARVLVYDHTGDLATAVKEALTAAAEMPEIVDCRRPKALADHLTEQFFDVLVAGPGLDSRAGFERLRIIREELPTMAIVLAVEGGDLDIRDVVRAGAVDLVELPSDAATLHGTLERALAISRATRGATGAGTALEPVHADGELPRRVITIASASGGCGKTFLATNLAWFLSHHAGRRVCIIDLDLQFGEVSASLRLRPRYTITDLIHHAADDDQQLADHFVEFCEQHETGIHVLAAPRDPTEAASIRPEDVGRIIDAARAHYDDVIIDTPPALADNVVVAFNRSDELFVMATLDIPSIRNMQVFLSTLDRLDVTNEGIRLLLNKAERDAGVEVRQVLKLFPQGFDATLPYAREVQRSINAGRPVLATNPASEISRQIGRSMQRLLPTDGQERYAEYESANRGSRFRRWSRKDRSETS